MPIILLNSLFQFNAIVAYTTGLNSPVFCFCDNIALSRIGYACTIIFVSASGI